MALVTTKEMFEKAYEGHYAIGAFNINNMEIIQGIVSACKKHNSAVILQVSKSALKYAHPLYLKKMVDAAIEETGIDIALHLDHGPDFDTCKLCIEAGFSSVMFDGSHLDYEENVAKTKEIVDYAHARGVVVEAELGKLAGVEDEVKVAEGHATYTDPDQAVDKAGKEPPLDPVPEGNQHKGERREEGDAAAVGHRKESDLAQHDADGD